MHHLRSLTQMRLHLAIPNCCLNQIACRTTATGLGRLHRKCEILVILTKTCLTMFRYNSYPSSSASAMTYSASGLGSFQTQSQLPHPFQTHSIPRMSQNISIPDVHGTRYTTQQPFLQAPGPSWTPRETWSHPTNMASDLRSGRQNSPPFEETKVLRDVFNYQGQRISPEIHASIPKGFFEVEGKWTCYRRNYFPVLCSFTTKPAVPDGAYLLQREGQQPARILEFAVSISAKTAVLNNQESQSRGLVQHTPKRDKATESTPGRVIIQPSTQTSPETRHPALHSYSSPQTVSPNMISHYESFSGGQHPTTPTQHTFERIQFQKATANNGKRRAQQQFFHVVVELWANVGHAKEDWVQLATRQSAQMVVRGRSPGHYKDNVRRDSTASMDPDRGTGSGGDSIFHGGGSTIGSHSHSNGGMDWSRTNGGGGHHYGGGTYRRQATDCSPESDNSSGTFTESHAEVEAGLETTPGAESPIDGACKPLEPQYGDGPDFDLGGSTDTTSLKRPYEGEHAFMPSMLESRRAYHVDAYLPSHLDFALSQPLPVS